MRIADKISYNQVNSHLSKNRTELSELQTQAATQKRINKPSDDPLAMTRVLAARTDEKTQLQFTKNLNIAKGFLEFSDQSLGELTDVLNRAKELAISQSSDASSNEESRKVVASEIEQLLFQSIQIGNRKLGDRYIFGGHVTTQRPFNHDGEYQGDTGDIKIQINKDSYLSMNIPGDKLFLGKNLNLDGVTRGELDAPTDLQQLKSYKKEIIQRAQQEDQNYSDEDLIIKKGRGPASISTNENSKDPLTDSTWRTQGINLFSTLKDLENSLQTNDKEGIQASLDTLDEAMAQVVLARSQVGARVMAINNTMETLQKGIIDSKIMASQLEDADVFKVVSDINKTDSALKATLETSGRLIQPSLLDFLK